MVGAEAATEVGHATGVGGCDLTGDVGKLICVAHGVIEELNATAFRDGVQLVGGGDAVEVCATARATGSGVRVPDCSIAGGRWEQGE